MTGCCGGRKRQRTRHSSHQRKLPRNPRVRESISLIYVGGPVRRFKGHSGLVYFVGPNRRGVDVHRRDVDTLVETQLFVELAN